MKTADWYFDFISPFACLAARRLHEFAGLREIRYRPVLFAGLLRHWDNKGPAEIEPKRLWTYRWCAWNAARLGVPFSFPAEHPFNPLPWLRLSIAAGNTPEAVERIFAALWTTGADPADPQLLRTVASGLGIDPARQDDPAHKEALRAGTTEAAARGVFGVPTLAIDGELFWGFDGLDFALAFARDPALLDTPEMRRIAGLPVGARRRDA
jgi:2-hydroxychromene-2-carboxylate isomerase